MNLAKVALGWAAVLMIPFGIAYIAVPGPMFALAKLQQLPPTALTDLRAMYGGVQLALGAFFALAYRKPEWHAVATVVLAALFGGLASVRLLGIVLDGTADAFHLAALAIEIPTTALAVVAHRRASA